MNATIYYFSATGNSLQAAKIIAEGIGANLQPMVSQKGALCESDVIGLVFPTYFWGVPRTVSEFIGKLRVKNRQPYVFAVTTYGKLHGGVLGHTSHLLTERGLRLNYGMAIEAIPNFIEEYNPMVGSLDQKLSRAAALAAKAAQDVASGRENGPFTYSLADRLFYRLYTHVKLNRDQGFHVDDTCVGCGICEKLCPNGSIVLTQGKPQFRHRCEHCVACINNCPQNAIPWKHSTQRRTRYRNPNVTLREILAGMEKRPAPVRTKTSLFQMSTEMERFELSRRLPDLPHFECGPFSHLGTSPKRQL